MPFRRIIHSFFNMGILFQVLSSNIFMLTLGYLVINLLIEPFENSSELSKSLKPLVETLTVIFVLALVVTIIAANTFFIARFYRLKYSDNHTSEIFSSTEIDFLQTIRNKVIVGLENIKDDLKADYSKKILPSISVSSTMLDHFPSDMRSEINAKIKGKTIFTLIEIAYQDPTETNPSNISKSLNIPLSSLSREIKRLISLNYLETHVSETVLQDARFRNFKITPKGFYFLSQLNNALKMTIDRLKLREINSRPF